MSHKESDTAELLSRVHFSECKLVWPVWRVLKTLRIELRYDPTIPRLGFYSKKVKALIVKDICSLWCFVLAKV